MPRHWASGSLAVADAVVQHVPTGVADTTVNKARSLGADLLLSIGGGSATGLAKAVAKELRLPILAVPTTYAGSEMTPIWGLTGPDGKSTGRDPGVQPRVVVYDPELTVSMPTPLTASSGMNAMAHCVEALYAPDVSPVVALVAAEGVRTLAAGLPRCVADPTDLAGRTDALTGAWLAGWSLGTATMGLHHKLCHVLGGLYDLPHAETHSVVLPYVVAFQRGHADEPLRRIADALGADDAATGLWNLGRSLGTPRSLAELGLASNAIDRVVTAVLANPPANPTPLTADGIRFVLTSALAGSHP